MRAPALLASLAATALLAGGCASTGSTVGDRPGTPHSMGAMSDQMPGMDMSGTSAGPSSTARMICGAEIRSTVRRTFALGSPPPSTHTWADHLFGCTYALPQGPLHMSVKDGSDERTGRAYFDRLRTRLTGATTLHGVEALGFPSFETPAGDVVFLKDGKTLHVDAGSLSRSGLPSGFTRADAAYAVAAAVIACWTE
jgi:hypothetical protein